jgi:hypothetical protein
MILGGGATTARQPASARTAEEKGPKEERRKTPAELAAPRWKKARAGLWWVLFGLVWLALPGFIPFGLAMYERAVESLPDGNGWVQIEGYVNDPGTPGALKLTKRQEILLLAYGVPFLLGGAAITLGRMTCAAVPRSSGAKGMFALSGLLSMVVVAGLVTAVGAYHLGFESYFRLILAGWVVVLLMGEFWFLTGLGVCGASLKRPRAARAVGLVVLVAGMAGGLVVAAVAYEWEVSSYRPLFDRPGTKLSSEKRERSKSEVEILRARVDEARTKMDDAVAVFKQAEADLDAAMRGVKQKAPPAKLPKKDKDKGEKAADVRAESKVVELPRPSKFEVVVRREKLDEEMQWSELTGGMIAWLLLIGVYWRAVGVTRWAIRDALERAEDAG